MSKRVIFKSVLSLILVFFMTFMLFGCKEGNQDLLNDALDDVAVVFATGDSLDSVTQDLTLPTDIGDLITIEWSSDKTDVISNAGVVTRPLEGQADETVILTATLSLGDLTASAEVTLTVKALVSMDQEKVDAAAVNTVVTYASGDSETMVTQNVVLPALVDEINVVWTTDMPLVISEAGVVARPDKGEADVTVVLTATLTLDEATATKTFTLIVLAIPTTDEELVDNAAEALEIGYAVDDDDSAVTQNIVLPTLDGEVAITWASDNAAVISEAGAVVRPLKGEADVTVTLTATLTLGDYSETEVFVLTVIAIPHTAVEAIEGLEIDVEVIPDSDPVRYVTVEDISLADYFMGHEVDWVSSNEAVIDEDGTVERPAYGETDSTVILTATIGDETKVFIVTVLAISEKPVDLVLQDGYNVLLIPGGIEIEDNINLPKTSGSEGVIVTWSSSDTSTITNHGVVVRKEVNTNVTLTATLHFHGQSMTKEFNMIVVAHEDISELTDVEIIANIIDELEDSFSSDYFEVESIHIPFAMYGATITWDIQADNVSRLVTGLVITSIPAEGQTVATLTATINRGDETDTVVITFSVGLPPVITIDAVIALADDAIFRTVGIVTAAEDGHRTYFIQDATGGISIFTRNGDFQEFLSANLGKEVEVIGERDTHKGLRRIAPLRFRFIGDGVMPTPVNLDDVALTNDTLLPYQGQLVEMTMLYVSNIGVDGWGNITFTLERLTEGTSIILRRDLRVSLSDEVKAILEGLEIGDFVDVTNVLAWRYIPRFLFTDQTIVVDVTPTTENLLALDAFVIEFEAEINDPMTLGLPAVGENLSAIVWTSSHDAIIDPATGAVVIPATETVVTLTATLTLDSIERVATYEILVRILPLSTVEQVINEAVDNKIHTIGVVTSAESNGTYFIQDATGGIAIYTSDAAMLAFLAANIGQEVRVFGTRDESNGLRQISPTDITAVGVGVIPDAVNVGDIANDDLLPYQGQLVIMQGLKATEIDIHPTFGNITITFARTDGSSIAMRWDSRTGLTPEATTLLQSIVVGTYYDITNPLAWRDGPRFLFTDTTTIVKSNLLTLDALALALPEVIILATTLDLPAAGDFGSAIAWASSHPEIIDAVTGIVTIPAVATVVTLTATLTIDAVDLIVSFMITVVQPDLYISEYIEGSSNNKAIEIYNPTDQVIDLSNYTVVRYSNGEMADPYTLALTGTLAPGEVLVIANSSAGQEILDQADITEGWPNAIAIFNGDDALVLYNNGVMIDVFGIPGNDPGSYWVVGDDSTKDHTLVRTTYMGPTVLWNPDEWTVYGQDIFTHLGSHTIS